MKHTLPIVLFLLCIIFASPVHGLDIPFEEEDDTQEQFKIRELLSALDATFRTRRKHLGELVAEAKGKNRAYLLRMMDKTLEGQNIQMILGVIEVYSRLGEPDLVPQLRDVMIFNLFPDARTSAIRHLPAFCVPDQAQRMKVVALAEGDYYTVPEPLQRLMRLPPFDPTTGKFSPVMDRTRQSVESAIATQLDPVDAVIQRIETKQHKEALDTLRAFLAVNLGHKRDAWLEFWQSESHTFVSPMQEEIQGAQIASCVILKHMGAEGSPYLVARMRWLADEEPIVVRQSALEATASLARYAYQQQRVQKEALSKADLSINEAERGWRQRRLKAHARTLSLAYEVGKKYALNKVPDIRAAAIACLGASREPGSFDSLLAAARVPGGGPSVQLQLIRSLGEIGTLPAVKELTRLAVYRDVAVDRREQVAEYMRVREAFEALGNVIGEGDAQTGAFLIQNPEASAAAFKVLSGHLTDTRRFTGAPPGQKGNRDTVQFFARMQLQFTLGSREISYDPAVWKTIYNLRLQPGDPVRESTE